jgi:hypothetical protein
LEREAEQPGGVKYTTIHFFGDKTFPGGNDYEIFSTQMIHTRRSKSYLTFDGHVPDDRSMVKMPKISAASIVPDIGF